MSEKTQPLRLITYLVPSIPVELFETIAGYLEHALKRESVLLYESRFNGPMKDRVDLFKANIADIGFITSESYQQLVKEDNKNWELLPVGGVYFHGTKCDDKGEKCIYTKGATLGYYADIIIHQSSKNRIKDFADLRGMNWATSNSFSNSGHFTMLKTLREHGENSSFFGSALNSGSHLNSIHMVATRQADVASVDSNVLGYALAKNSSLNNDIYIYDSIGPLPSYPIMVRASMSAEEKKAIGDALLELHKVSPWNGLCSALRLVRFDNITKDIYLADREIRDKLANLSTSVHYY